MKYFLGIDGGGTKTEALVCREDGMILSRGIAGSSNPLFIDKSEAFETIVKLIRSVSNGHEGEYRNHFHAAVCVPGFKKFRSDIEKILLEFCDSLFIDGDEMNAFLGAVAKPYGVVVVSGTGSFAFGINRKQEKIELGGWGPLLGDEGSGYYIGLSSLKAVIRAYEHAGPDTILTSGIMEFFQINSINELKRKVYSKEFDRSSMGNLSKLVEAAARQGDTVSLKILDSAAYELADLANRVIENLNMDDGVYDVVLTGGVRKFQDLIIKPFTGYINAKHNDINVRGPEFEPVVGSLLIAMREAGVDIMNEEILRNLRYSYSIK